MALFHQAAANLVSLIGALQEHGGWMSTSEVADQADVHRDTARKILAELKLYDWVNHQELEGEDRWRLGLALPRLGLAHQARLVAAMKVLRREMDELCAPVERLLDGEVR